MRYVESYLERCDIPYNYRGRQIYIATRDRYQPKEICDHLKIPEIQYFEDWKRSSLFVPNKKFIRRDANSYFEKQRLSVTLAEVTKLQAKKKKQTKAADKFSKPVSLVDNDGISLAKFEKPKRDKIRSGRDKTNIELDVLKRQTTDQKAMLRETSISAKLAGIDIFADDISKLSDEEIALWAEHWYLKSRIKPGDKIPLPQLSIPEKVFANANIDRLQPQYEWSKWKSIIPLVNMKKINQWIRRKIIMKKVSDKMYGTSNPLHSTICFHQLIPNTDTYYMCHYISYKQQSAIFHMVFSHEFSTKSIAIDTYPKHQIWWTLALFIRDFFDANYILKNKKKVFRQPEYFLVFTNCNQGEYDRCFAQMIDYLSIPKKKLVKNVNLVSLWDYCPQLSRVVDYRKWNMKRFIKKLTRGLTERWFTVSDRP